MDNLSHIIDNWVSLHLLVVPSGAPRLCLSVNGGSDSELGLPIISQKDIPYEMGSWPRSYKQSFPTISEFANETHLSHVDLQIQPDKPDPALSRRKARRHDLFNPLELEIV